MINIKDIALEIFELRSDGECLCGRDHEVWEKCEDCEVIRAAEQKSTYFIRGDIKKCNCGAAHDICLDCIKCRVKKSNKVEYDLENINKHIDHTLLHASALEEDIERLADEYEKYNFKSICVHPYYVSLLKKRKQIKNICSVAGFPLGMNELYIKVNEALDCTRLGAKEVDFVINIGALKDGYYQTVFAELIVIKVEIKSNIKLKAIIETCLLTDEEIVIASLINKKAGADFIKTSTGFSTKGAEARTVKLIRDTVGDYMGVKASGGIKTRQQVIDMMKAGANRIGTSNSVAIMQENKK
ncbi:MAG: deoxyribose-phosphate aldolase [Candidatus Cloacimonetes bacterium]|nr:deoxyribose-phosphate aldolase [Candidatus Cloacimonadota bacterium]